ncbi:MAG: hypothetical protein HY017_03790 [Betaproteobacteria bacterium]|nr:hypothetical protein [Betaproteobacteria bacterium]
MAVAPAFRPSVACATFSLGALKSPDAYFGSLASVKLGGIIAIATGILIAVMRLPH